MLRNTLIISVFCAILSSCGGILPKSWVIYPSQSKVFNYRKTAQIPQNIVNIAIEVTSDVLANHNIHVSKLPKKISVYSVSGFFPCDGNPYNMDNTACNGVTYFADHPDYVESWVNTDRITFSNKFCWADTSLVHELMHTLLAETDENHEREGAWNGGDPNSIVSLANAELRAKICLGK